MRNQVYRDVTVVEDTGTSNDIKIPHYVTKKKSIIRTF
jgi:hypothetical protein